MSTKEREISIKLSKLEAKIGVLNIMREQQERSMAIMADTIDRMNKTILDLVAGRM